MPGSALLCVVLGLRSTVPLSFTPASRLFQTKTARVAAALRMNAWQRSDSDAAAKAAWLAKHPAQPWARKTQAAKNEVTESVFDGSAEFAETIEAPALAERPAQEEATPAETASPESTPWMNVEFGEESPMPGREKEFEAHKAQTAQGPVYAPPSIDPERRSRSPGLHHNFFDVSTADFKRPHGSGPAPATPEATRAAVARGSDAGVYSQAPTTGRFASPVSPSPTESVESRSPQDEAKAAWLAKQAPVPWATKAASAANQMAAAGNAAVPAADAAVAPTAGLPASQPSTGRGVDFGAEAPLPGRQKEYEAFKEAVADGTAGPAYAPPPIDEERRSRSPGLHRNFFDAPTSDFKRPHGFGGAPRAPEPPRAPTASSSTGPRNAGVSSQASGFGAETSLPGREKEYEAFKEAVADGTAGPAYAPPPIDEERRSRSPGLHRNFFDVPTSDFKRPHGFGGAPRAPEPPRAPTASPSTGPRNAGVSSQASGFGAETPLPGREKEYEAFKEAVADGTAGPAYAPPPIDEERRSRSPGLHRNFFDVPTSDFKRPHGFGGAPRAPEPPRAPTASSSTGPRNAGVSSQASGFGAETPLPGREKEYEAFKEAVADGTAGPAYAPPPIDEERRSRSPGLHRNFFDVPTSDFKRPHGFGGAPRAPEPPRAPTASPSTGPRNAGVSSQASGFGAETPLPGREKEYEAFKEAVADGTAGPAYAPPPIDEERRSRSPGLHRNFFDVPTSDFKRPHGFGGAPRAPEPPRAPTASSSTGPRNAGVSSQASGFGAETPLPGREKEYEAFKEAVADGTAGPAYAPPPIDEERRSRSPGLHRNFFDVPTSDFKRPHGFGGAPRAPEPPRAPTASSSTGPRNAGVSSQASGFGAETPLPGREKEYEAFKEAVADGTAGPAYAPPPIDEERRSRSPGLHRNFFDVPTSDFKRPHGFGGAPRAPEPPRAPTASSSTGPRNAGASSQASGFGAETPLPGREEEYEAFKEAVADGTVGPAYAPPPIDEERRSRSPGLHRNFFDVPTSDFKRPHGFDGAPRAPEPPRAPTASPFTGPRNAGVSSQASGFGAETPLPGREKEYEAFKEAVADGTAGPVDVPPAIDEERKSRSPGLQRNFYDVSTTDFKRPHGFGGAPHASEAPSSVDEQHCTIESSGSPAGYEAETVMPWEAADDPMPSAVAESAELSAAAESPLLSGADELPVLPTASESSVPSAVDESPVPWAEDESPDPPAATEFAEQSAAFEASATSAAATRGELDVATPLERSLERLQAALAEAQAREETARREAAEAREREKSLAQRFEALEERLEKVASNVAPADTMADESPRAREREEALLRRLAAVEAALEAAALKASTASSEAEESNNAGTNTGSNSSRVSLLPSHPRSQLPHSFPPSHGFAPFAPQSQPYAQVPLRFAPFTSQPHVQPPQNLAPTGHPGLQAVPTIGASLIRELLVGLAPGSSTQAAPTTETPVVEPYPSPLIWLRGQAHAARRPHNT